MSETITPTVVIITFIVIIILAIIAAWYFGGFNDFKNTHFNTFIIVLTGLSIVITFLFYFSIVQLQEQETDLAVLQETARISDLILNSLFKAIQEGSAIIPNFTASINPLMLCGVSDLPPDPVTLPACTQKSILSYQIFSLWQDIIIGDQYTALDQLAYITSFLQRANSTQLSQQWVIQKINFNNITQSFGDLLFQYGLVVTPQTPDAYVAAAKQLINDPKYQALIK